LNQVEKGRVSPRSGIWRICFWHWMRLKSVLVIKSLCGFSVFCINRIFLSPMKISREGIYNAVKSTKTHEEKKVRQSEGRLQKKPFFAINTIWIKFQEDNLLNIQSRERRC
jgi:hypothetical protein